MFHFFLHYYRYFTVVGVKDEMAFNCVANHIKSCESKPKSEVDPKTVTDTPWYKAEFEGSTAKATPINHKVEVSTKRVSS